LLWFTKKVKLYESCTEGAKEGFTTAVRIVPFLTAMLVSIEIFRASGGAMMVEPYFWMKLLSFH